MFWFALPLTGVTLVTVVVREFVTRQPNRPAGG
jgi:hypothetical protein